MALSRESTREVGVGVGIIRLERDSAPVMFHDLVHSPKPGENEADVIVICRNTIIDRDCLADKRNGHLVVAALMSQETKAIETLGMPRIHGENAPKGAFRVGEPAGRKMREGQVN